MYPPEQSAPKHPSLDCIGRGRESGLALSPRTPLGPPGSQPFLWASPRLLSGQVQPERVDLSLGLRGQIPLSRLFLLSPAGPQS